MILLLQGCQHQISTCKTSSCESGAPTHISPLFAFALRFSWESINALKLIILQKKCKAIKPNRGLMRWETNHWSRQMQQLYLCQSEMRKLAETTQPLSECNEKAEAKSDTTASVAQSTWEALLSALGLLHLWKSRSAWNERGSQRQWHSSVCAKTAKWLLFSGSVRQLWFQCHLTCLSQVQITWANPWST